MRKILWFENNTYKEYAFIEKRVINNALFFIKDNKIFYKNKTNEIEIVEQKKYQDELFIFVILNSEVKKFTYSNNTILIGNSNSNIIINSGRYVFTKKQISKSSEDILYINGVLISSNVTNFKKGQSIIINNYIELMFFDSYFEIRSNPNLYNSNEQLFKKQYELTTFPFYQRSPRIMKKLNENKIKLIKPGPKASRSKGSLAKIIIPPLTMAIGTITMSFMMGRGIYVIVGLGATITTLGFSVTSFISQEKELKEKNISRIKRYEEYVLKMRKKLDKLKLDEISVLSYNFPSQNEILNMINDYNSRIYERDFNDFDFLSINVGFSKQRTNYEVNLDYDQLQDENEPLLKQAKELTKEFKYVNNKPSVVDLKTSHLGLVGDDVDVHKYLKNLISQISFFHSYHDVQMLMLYNEKYLNEFSYLKWYPHFKIEATNLTGDVHNLRIRDQVIGSLLQILKTRNAQKEENSKVTVFKPHYVIIVDDLELIQNHPIMEYFQNSEINLGFSLILTAQKQYNLPQNIKSVVNIKDESLVTLVINNEIEINEKLNFESSSNINLEKSARNLNSLIHMQTQKSQIPEKVTFLDLYKVQNLEELNLKIRWNNACSHKSLSVPLGFRSQDDIVSLNLHERAHGPHGLVAGTTGSGKSEIIQSYILSLAVNFSPYEVGFLLIDYKGGGMANLFKKLPHLLGTITNLDGSESMRALVSIKAELSRRQRIFNDHDVNNINLYNQLFKNNEASEPLPHLFIISDEFAELKKEQPEFMSELVSVARIGRTLGVHLILATQKPTGVVDDQIWSNSKFKLALKVQNESDSKEILKTPDAAFLTQAGRAYLQVGNNEIYELFQSAWSGAPYSNEIEEEKIDDRIYKINDLGQGEIINEDLSESKSNKKTITQLDGVVNYIEKEYVLMNLKEVVKPWLPSLKTRISNPNITKIVNSANITKIDTIANIGLIDIPEKQEQKEYNLDFSKEGNLAIFASSGFGKSTTLATIIMSLCLKNNPMLLNMYILDFGNSALITFKSLPNVADYMDSSEIEKIQKLQVLVEEEIKNRKKLLSQSQIQNVNMYNELNPDTKIPAMFIIVDNFDVVKEVPTGLEDFLTKLTRDGVSLGIYTIISATRSNALRFATMNNFNKKIVQYTFDESESYGLLGRSTYKLNETKGRALIKNEIVSMMQIYLAVESNDDIEYNTKLKQTINELNNLYTGEKLKNIPTLPDSYSDSDFSNYKNETKDTNLIGLCIDSIEAVSAPISASPFLIVGPSKTGKTNLLKILLNQTKDKTYIFDSDSMELLNYANNDNVSYINTPELVEKFKTDFENLVEARTKELNMGLSIKKYKMPIEFLNDIEHINVIIDDADMFINLYSSDTNFLQILKDSKKLGVNIIATTLSTKLKTFGAWTDYFKQATCVVAVGKPSPLSVITLNTVTDKFEPGMAYLSENGSVRKILIPKASN